MYRKGATRDFFPHSEFQKNLAQEPVLYVRRDDDSFPQGIELRVRQLAAGENAFLVCHLIATDKDFWRERKVEHEAKELSNKLSVAKNDVRIADVYDFTCKLVKFFTNSIYEEFR